jgi:hypothetical protein
VAKSAGTQANAIAEIAAIPAVRSAGVNCDLLLSPAIRRLHFGGRMAASLTRASWRATDPSPASSKHEKHNCEALPTGCGERRTPAWQPL